MKLINYRQDNVKMQSEKHKIEYKTYCKRKEIKSNYREIENSLMILVTGNPYKEWDDSNLEQLVLRYDLLIMSEAYMRADMDMEVIFDLLKEYANENNHLVNQIKGKDKLSPISFK